MTKRTESLPEWFTYGKFGMFIHWGLYSLAARHEWVMTREKISVEDYSRYFEHFDPDLFDPEAWARAAKAAGMTYVVLTTKHHEGFCLWDSTFTDYKSTRTPAGRDLVAEFVRAMRAHGLKVGFYYSLLDWHHPDFTIDDHHPLRDDPHVEELNAQRDMERYRHYVRDQVTELLSNYGTVDYLFFDFSYPEGLGRYPGKGKTDWDSEELLHLVRTLAPKIIVNDRLDIPGDVLTPEQYQPAAAITAPEDETRQDDVDPLELPRSLGWEACQTLNGSWGYDRDNHNFKSADLLIRMLIDGVANGGNLLLNVGPTARGLFDAPAVERLAEIGSWLNLHGRAIYGAGPSTFQAPPDTRYTQREDRLYLHLFAWPFGHIHLPGLAGKVDYAQLLNDGSEIPLLTLDPNQQALTTEQGGQPEGTLTLILPVQPPQVEVPVIELFLKKDSTLEKRQHKGQQK